MNANSPVDKDGMGAEFAINAQLHKPTENLCEKTCDVFLFQQPGLSTESQALVQGPVSPEKNLRVTLFLLNEVMIS